jgi:hypothetical protein
MTITQAELLRKAAGPIATGDFTAASGLLAAEQANTFLDMVYDGTPFAALQRAVRRRAKTGTVAKIGIGGRLLRPKTAGLDDATLQKPLFGDVSYTCVRMRLDWEVEEEVFEENIEGEGLEDHLMRLMTEQIGRDLEDLHFNGATADTSSDAAFLTMNQGWLAQLAASGDAHRVNGGAVNSGNIAKDHFFDALEAMPGKYKSQGGLRWIGSGTLFDRYAEALTNRATAAGDAILTNGQVTEIAGYPVTRIPAMPNSRLLLAVPGNFIVVNTRDIRNRKTTEGREAIREDKRFYAVFIDDDPIIEEEDAVVDVYGLAA